MDVIVYRWAESARPGEVAYDFQATVTFLCKCEYLAEGAANQSGGWQQLIQ